MSRRNVAAPTKAERRIRERELADVAWLIEDERGRRLLWRIFSVTGIFRTSFTGNSETFFNEGKRAVGTTLLGELMEAGPDAFALMQHEARKQAELDEHAALIDREESDG